MCGPSSAEESLQSQLASFSSLLQQNYSTLFGKQQGVLDAINRSLSPILRSGPSQRGMSAEERAARQSQLIAASGAANRMAQQAARTFGAGEGGGGTSGVTSGITKQIESAIASEQAGNLGAGQAALEAQDWGIGRENFWRAQGGSQALAAGYSPNEAMQGGISANQGAFSEAKTIHEQSMEASQMIAGGVTALAGGAASFLSGGLSNLDTKGTSTFGEQLKNVFTGGFENLGGSNG